MQKRYNKLRTIALVGLPGSGKSSVGKALAELLSCPFADCDEVISATTGLSIPELFSQRGELAFRALESRVLDELCQASAEPSGALQDADRLVLATGGGCVLSEGNRQLLRELCWVVWLDVSSQAAARRLAESAGKSGATGRPLLDGGNAEERLVALDTERRPLYAGLADMRVDAEGSGYGALARRVAQALSSLALEDKHAALS